MEFLRSNQQSIRGSWLDMTRTWEPSKLRKYHNGRLHFAYFLATFIFTLTSFFGVVLYGRTSILDMSGVDNWIMTTRPKKDNTASRSSQATSDYRLPNHQTESPIIDDLTISELQAQVKGSIVFPEFCMHEFGRHKYEHLHIADFTDKQKVKQSSLTAFPT